MVVTVGHCALGSREVADPTATGDSEVPSPPEYPGTPAWVRVFGFVVTGLVVVLVLVLAVGTALGLHTPMGPGGHGR